jgi:hypothetical protein
VSNSPTVLTGSIECITFYSDETGCTVARFLALPLGGSKSASSWGDFSYA